LREHEQECIHKGTYGVAEPVGLWREIWVLYRGALLARAPRKFTCSWRRCVSVIILIILKPCAAIMYSY
jgi:hypothetical protein